MALENKKKEKPDKEKDTIILTPLPEPPKLPDFGSQPVPEPPMAPSLNDSAKSDTRGFSKETTPMPSPPTAGSGEPSPDMEPAGAKIQEMQEQLAAKEKELEEWYKNSKEIKEKLSEVANVIKAKDAEIDQLRSSLDLIQGELKNKENSLFRAKAKIEVLEESGTRAKRELVTLKKKFTDLEEDKRELEKELQLARREKEELELELKRMDEQSESKIDTLRKEKFEINDRLKLRIAEVDQLKDIINEKEDIIAKLESRIDGIQEREQESEILNPALQIQNEIIKGRENILKLIDSLLDEAFHNVMIVVPSINDLKNIDLARLKPSVKIRIATDIDMGVQDELDLYEMITSTGNIEFRIFDRKDRYGMNLERGKVLMGFHSNDGPVAILTSDEAGIDLFNNNIITECWTLGRRPNF